MSNTLTYHEKLHRNTHIMGQLELIRLHPRIWSK
jgi:hypothetical protein